MKQFLQNIGLPFTLFIAALALMACSDSTGPTGSESTAAANTSSTEQQPQQATLKSGNMFAIVRDVADVQLKAGPYVEQLQSSKASIEEAVNAQNMQQVSSSVTQLKQQLTAFNQSLSSLNLSSQEIDQIRQNMIQSNQQLLATPLLNGQIDLSKVNVAALEKQMGSVQNEMLKLASMLLTEPEIEPSSGQE